MFKSQQMERGIGSDALRAHLSNTATMNIRQTRRGWLQECFGCEARTEFKYFVNQNQVAHSLEDASCCCRFCCAACYPFTAAIKEVNTDAELLTLDRPFKCSTGNCKCCCYQIMHMTSGGQPIGHVKENCTFCIPAYSIYDQNNQKQYIVHPPTCCCGMCVNCCTEGCPCSPKGCCKMPCWIFDPVQGEKAPHLGKIVKVPKSLWTELLTDANAFEVTFPEQATVQQKALLMGSAVLFNANHFEDRG